MGGSGTSSPQPPEISPQQHSAICEVTLCFSHLEGMMCSSPTPSGPVSRGPPCAGERVERSPGHQAGSLRWPMATAVRDLLLPSGASAETAAPGSWVHPLAAEWSHGAPGLPAAGPMPAWSMRASHPQALFFPTKPLCLAFHLIRRTFNPPVHFRDRLEPGWGCEALMGSL